VLSSVAAHEAQVSPGKLPDELLLPELELLTVVPLPLLPELLLPLELVPLLLPFELVPLLPVPLELEPELLLAAVPLLELPLLPLLELPIPPSEIVDATQWPLKQIGSPVLAGQSASVLHANCTPGPGVTGRQAANGRSEVRMARRLSMGQGAWAGADDPPQMATLVPIPSRTTPTGTRMSPTRAKVLLDCSWE
jgi:hypothetical protein